jgi:superfamily II DNA or RNA helicase
MKAQNNIEHTISEIERIGGFKFYDIQKTIIRDDREKTGIFLGTGVGKTLPSLVLSEGSTLVVCPKQQKLDRTWQKNDLKFSLGKFITVVSKEEFRRDWESYGLFTTVVFDECHNMLGVSPETRQRNRIQIPKTSQIFEACLLYLRKHPPNRFYMVSATPVTKPMNMWALAKLFGKDWDFFKFRSTFYFPTMMGRRQVWLPRKDDVTKQRLALNVQKFGYTGALKDFMDVPEQTHIEKHIELSDEQKHAIKKLSEEEADPLVRRSRMRTIENGVLYGKKVEEISEKVDRMVKDTIFFKNGKIEYILERAVEFPKMMVFAAYTAQVEAIATALREEGHKVFTVTGATKDRSTVFEEVEALDEGIIVVAAQICEGYRVPSAPCMIFASKSNRFLHYDQGKGRILDGQHLKKNLYIHLIVPDGADEDCHESIMSGQDFQEKLSVL